MSANTSIEWTDRTWNPVRGCSVISPGCHNCYAMKQAHRFSGPGRAYEGLTKLTKAGPQWTGVIRTVDDALLEPLSWRRPSRVFVNSMSDLFHEDVPDAFIAMVFSVMASSEHTYQVLTKRPERMRNVVSRLRWKAGFGFVEFGGKRNLLSRLAFFEGDDSWEVLDDRGRRPLPLVDFVAPNVWLGVSVENQHVLERIDILKDVPASVHFVSFEPLLEHLGALLLDGVQWVIVGGESGPGARPFGVAWARSIVAQCKAAGVPVFVKQLGAVPIQNEEEWRAGDGHGRISLLSARNHRRAPDGFVPLAQLNRKGGDLAEWPEDLRVREFPAVRS